MKSWWPFLAVAVLNVCLNLLALRVGNRREPFPKNLMSLDFLVTFSVGTCSLVMLVFLYSQSVSLPRGVLLVGAGSIIFGTILGVIAFGAKLSHAEWCLFAAIAIFYGYRILHMA